MLHRSWTFCQALDIAENSRRPLVSLSNLTEENTVLWKMVAAVRHWTVSVFATVTVTFKKQLSLMNMLMSLSGRRESERV